MPTGITLCSGIGTLEARLKDIVNFVGFAESDDNIAAYHDMAHGVKRNYGNVMHIAEKLDVDYIHASPPCVTSSSANTNVTMADRYLETAIGKAIADVIRKSKPKLFTLENVIGYRQTDAYLEICSALDGYVKQCITVDAASLGALCTRERMFLIASYDDVNIITNRSSKPPAVHWPTATGYDFPSDIQVDEFLKGLAYRGYSRDGHYLFDPTSYNKKKGNMPISPPGLGFTLTAARQRKYCYAKNTLYTWNHGSIRSYSSRELLQYMGLEGMIAPNEARVARFLLGNGIHGAHIDHIIRPAIERLLW